MTLSATCSLHSLGIAPLTLMADISYIEKNRLEKLFGMKSGYVLNFSDKTFREFVFGSTGKDIYDSDYNYASGSKANRLRAFWDLEPDPIVGKLLDDLLSYLSDEDEEVSESTLFANCRAVASKLLALTVQEVNSEKDVLARDAELMSKASKDPRNVFVVHGRNHLARNALFRFLRSIGLRPIEWSQAVDLTKKASPYIGEILDAAFAYAKAVVVLMTPDDEARLRGPYHGDGDHAYEHVLTAQSRANVLFEAGMAMGRDSDRTVLLELGQLRPFSDIGGRHVVKLKNSVAARQNIANRLKRAGCPVDLTGTDWHTEGDFDSIILNEQVNAYNEEESDLQFLDVNAIFMRLSQLGIYDDFYLYYEIPSSVRRNASNLFVPTDENILAFLDNTETTSGRSGIAFTNNGLFWRNPREQGQTLSWEEMRGSTIIEVDYDEVRLGDNRFDLSNSEVSPEELANTLRDIVSIVS